MKGSNPLSVIDDVRAILRQSLQLGERANALSASTGLFGNIPELDSMAVVTLVTALEARFNIAIEDDEITADIFDTVGSLARFVESKLGI